MIVEVMVGKPPSVLKRKFGNMKKLARKKIKISTCTVVTSSRPTTSTAKVTDPQIIPFVSSFVLITILFPGKHLNLDFLNRSKLLR